MGLFAHEAAGSNNDANEGAARLAARMSPEQAEKALKRLNRSTIAPALGTIFTHRTTEHIPVPASLPPLHRPRVPRTNTGAELPLQ